MTFGVDYAFGDPKVWASAAWIAALEQAGVKWVGRYVSAAAANDGNGKNLLPAEQKALHAAGLGIVLFAEEGATRMLGGHPAGVADAVHFGAVANALGMRGAVMFSCADFDATPAQQAALNDYQDGAESVLGSFDRVGIYGGYYVVNRTLNAGKAKYACQTMAWSSTTKDYAPAPDHAVKVAIGSGYYWFDVRAGIRQGLQKLILAHEVDADQAVKADFGQWPRPVVTPPPPPPATRTVPDVVGMTEQDAVDALYKAGLHPHGLPLAHVKAQSPAAGAKVPDGTVVTITTG